MYADGGEILARGRAIHAGLCDLRLDDWVLVIDADIVLPKNTRETLQHLGLVRNAIYGIDRVHCRGWEPWNRFMTGPRQARGWEVRFLRDFPVGARIEVPPHIIGDAYAGYVPCGYFQLWNASTTGIRDYPDRRRGTAEGSDILHSLRLPRMSRHLIPELVGIQLESCAAGDPVGVNWAGRRTPEFSAAGGPYRR